MSNLENHLFEQSFELIAQRFSLSSTEQQHELLCQLDAIAKKQTPIETHRSQADVLADIRNAMDGERARLFFGHSFPSWYRNGSIEQVSQLHHWTSLDMGNRHLFLEMLGLRDLGHFDDEALYQFEQFCLSAVGTK
ncbi:hypothetical protein CWO08_18500 [Vibrio sp. 10N.286.48.B8]|uniref:hypothetical protein n=1 Tax=Vibrio sp. 10N.286.48.B8 TaxID=2056189 RepID=UPI000D3459E3|nr:hypothetical protein [Vibrio sp. 10N.286.48.B8]PTO92717.1 hypothetical protein CWO08_18500 [Vibrio sp. 10N.286.48.B8]